jgi:hypothetical protein
MLQSEFLQRKLDRAKVEAEAEIALLTDKMNKEAELSGTGSLAYQQMAQQREGLQKQLEAVIIKSEQDITEAKAKEAEKQVEIMKDSTQRSMSVFNDLLDMIAQRRRGLVYSVSSLLTEGWEDVKKYFGGWKAAMGLTVDDVQLQIKNFMKNTTMASYDTFWNASLYGRKLVEMAGTSIYEWSARVAEYVNYVKGLMMSLREQIMSYQDQLDELRGNEVAILDRWYQKEMESLKAKYSGELQNTAEYQQAVTLLNEIYAEKRKKIMEDEAQAHEQYMEEMTSTPPDGGSQQTGTGGGSQGAGIDRIGPNVSQWQGMAERLNAGLASTVSALGSAVKLATEGIPKEVKVEKTVKNEWVLDIRSLPSDFTRRWFEDEIWPMIQRKQELEA